MGRIFPVRNVEACHTKARSPPGIPGAVAEGSPAASGPDAKKLIDETLNGVENELTDIKFDPAHWRTDGRMYPVQDDNASDVDGHAEVTSYRSRKHETLIRENGAFEIRDANTQEVLASKAGSDGKGVWS